MSEDYKTFREVSQAIGGLHRLINVYAAIFGAVVAVALGGYGLIFTKIDSLEVATATIDTRLAAVEARLIGIEASLAKISADTGKLSQQASLDVPQPAAPANQADGAIVEKMRAEAVPIAQFFTDSGMQTLREDDEVKVLFNQLPPQAQQVMVKTCQADGVGSSLCTIIDKM